MPLDRGMLEKLITEAFPDASVKLVDLAGDNDHWSVEIASEQFQGMSRIAQHRMVYDALGGRMGGELHALQVKTKIKETA
jgi:stress-induced morphogen